MPLHFSLSLKPIGIKECLWLDSSISVCNLHTHGAEKKNISFKFIDIYQ